MAVEVLIPTALRPFVENQESVEIEAQTVEELLDRLINRYEKLRLHMMTEEGGIRRFVNIYVNDEDIRYLDRYQTALKNGDVVTIVPAIAGGAGEKAGRIFHPFNA